MKDFYSFHSDEKDAESYYEKMKGHYENIFNKCGIGEKTYLTFASGGSFSKYSHEYQTITDAGEDIIYVCDKCKVAINKEIIGEQAICPQCGNKDLKENKSIEVGNIFSLKTKFSEPFDLKFTDENGQEKLMLMGCYGIGLGAIDGRDSGDKQRYQRNYLAGKRWLLQSSSYRPQGQGGQIFTAGRKPLR